MTGHYCPVEGCPKAYEGDVDAPPFDDSRALQGHVVAMNDEAHREAKDAKVWNSLESGGGEDDAEDSEGTDEEDDAPEEGKEAPSEESLEADEAERGVQGGEQDENEDSTGMDDQWKPGDGGDEELSVESVDDARNTAPSNGGGGISLPVSKWSLVMLLGAIAVAVVLWRARSRSQGSVDPDERGEPDEGEEPRGSTIDRDSGGGLQ
jgi:hypothetical protein